MKKPWLVLAPFVLVTALALTACGTNTTGASAPAANASSQTASTGSSTASQTSATTAKPGSFAMTIMPGGKLGSDGKMHDAFTPTDITVVKGVPTTVTVYNYDDGAHDVVASDLKLNVQIPGSKSKGVPSVTTFTINADKTGTFTWLCNVPCDGAGNPNKPGSNKGWAMSQDGYMMGKINVVDQMPVAQLAMDIIPGYQKGSDGKMHDTFSPADLTLQKGVKTQVTVYNYDTGNHDIVSSDLGLNVQIAAAKTDGTPAVTTFTVTATKTGDFHWLCNVPCDGAGDKSADSANGWAMSHDGFMSGIFHVAD